MYTEENAKGRFPLRDILLKAIVVIIFIILIIFIISKLTAPNNSKSAKEDSNYDKVFNQNIALMETAAYTYFTKDKLPTEVGDVSELTLREMINSNLLEAFTDADGKACNVTESYIRLTKNTDDYTLRVNLVCDQKEDYTLTKVGEYDYCEHDICKRDSSKEESNDQKEDSEEPTKEVDITEPTNDTASTNTSRNNTYAYVPNTNNNNNNNNSNNNQAISTTMYEYRKEMPPVLSEWSSWSDWDYNNKRYTAIKCASTDTSCLREVQLFSRREKIGTKNGKPVYATVNYYSYRTRTLQSSGSSDIKWSTYNDTNLLNQGYTYTGNTR